MSLQNRTSINLRETYVIIRGLLDKGINLYGPFDTVEEALRYGDKNFPDDTREIIKMCKEITVYGED